MPMSFDPCRYVVRYSGLVQGVGFRMTAISQADRLRINGLVRNESDGSVLMDVEGPEHDLRELMRRIETAMGDKIESVDAEQLPARGVDDGFRIAY
jgi:acylphosphatase